MDTPALTCMRTRQVNVELDRELYPNEWQIEWERRAMHDTDGFEIKRLGRTPFQVIEKHDAESTWFVPHSLTGAHTDPWGMAGKNLPCDGLQPAEIRALIRARKGALQIPRPCL